MGKAQIGLQLYTLREALAEDFAGTLRQVAAMGYAGVETAFFGGDVSLADASAQLRHLGLTVFSAHVDLPVSHGDGDKRDAVLRHAEAMGCQRIVWHGWPQDERYGSLDGVRRLADDYNAANEVAVVNGLQLGLHNHWWEMTPVSGELPYQLLLKWLHPSIFFELDTYWATVAGRHAVSVIGELGSRAPLLHIKDGPAVHGQPMVAVGSGAMDIPAILAASAETAEWLIVELDACATDMVEAVRGSLSYLKSIV